MRLFPGRTLLVSFVLLVVVGLVGHARQGQQAGQAQGQPQQQGRGAAPQNLKVLPKDWTASAGHGLDADVHASLGVQCTHCHAGTPPQLNYAADEKPTKEVARKMIHMVMHINDEHLKGIGSAAPASPPAAGAPPPLGNGPEKVSCFTCHRGALKPLTAPAGGGGN